MNTIRWNPTRELRELLAFGGHYPAAFRSAAKESTKSQWRPSSDIQELDDSYEIRMDLPAVDPESLSISVHNNALKVDGERSRATAQDDHRAHHQERYHGSFSRTFLLPEDADTEAITASARHGELLLTITKQASAKPRKIEVQAA